MALVDNIPLRHSLTAFAAESNQATYLDVIRNTLQGDLLLDSTGSTITMADDSHIAAGSTFAFHEGIGPDGERALFAFTRQDEVIRMHADTPDAVQTLGQPAAATLEFAAEHGYHWLYIDPAGPTCAIKISDVDFALRTHRNEAVKAAIFAPKPHRTGAVVDALSRGGQLLYAVQELPDEQVQVRTSTSPSGEPVALAFTSAAEVLVRNATDAWAAIDIERIVADALAPPFTGLIINPGGPWGELTRDDLLEVQRRLPRS